MPRKRVKRARQIRAARSMPLGVKIISVLAYIGAGLMALFAVLLLITGIWLSSSESADALKQLAAGFGAISTEITPASVLTYTILIAVVCVLLAVINFFVGRGLMHGKQWARILVIIYSAIQVLNGIGTIVTRPGSGIFTIVLYGIIGGYLAFSAEVKKFFR